MAGDGQRLGVLKRVMPVVVLAVLVISLVAGVAPNFDTRMVEIGEGIWPGYAADLRRDPIAPDCDLAELRSGLGSCVPDASGPPTEADPFAPPVDPFAAPAPAADPFAPMDTPKDDPFSTAPTAPNCIAVQSLVERCEARHTAYSMGVERITSGVRVWRTVELSVASLAHFGWWKHLLVVLVILGGLTTTLRRSHIALREPQTPTEHWVSQCTQLVAHLLLLVSCLADYQVQATSSAEVQNLGLPILWAVGFLALGAANVAHLVEQPAGLDGSPSRIRLLMVVPLYVWLVLLSGIWFFGVEHHLSGQAIFLHKFVQHPSIYLGIGLYIWAGMLLERTRIATGAFDLVTPWGLPAPLLAWVVVVIAAVPTAYSGASGIFVIAAGAEIFRRLRDAGASKQLALAATAMSGSLGVVLRPCLVVVLVAVLNKQVTTDELFGMGLYVFALTAGLFLVAMLIAARHSLRFRPIAGASSATLRAVRALLPFFAIGCGALAVYGVILDTWLSEHTAAFILPGILLALVVYDRRVLGVDGDRRVWPSLFAATSSSGHHIGALLMLMCASVCFGGVVERAEVMAYLPMGFGSVAGTMAVLVVVMVLVGMTMDALGAVVLVSFTVAQFAYANGIDPVHFWMMVLVAFELGYLTPPVAINHLLARQVIGVDAQVERDNIEGGFLVRYQHILVPMAVMSTALLIVAFVPLLWYPPPT